MLHWQLHLLGLLLALLIAFRDAIRRSASHGWLQRQNLCSYCQEHPNNGIWTKKNKESIGKRKKNHRIAARNYYVRPVHAVALQATGALTVLL